MSDYDIRTDITHTSRLLNVIKNTHTDLRVSDEEYYRIFPDSPHNPKNTDTTAGTSKVDLEYIESLQGRCI